jgi:hypothetical protein
MTEYLTRYLPALNHLIPNDGHHIMEINQVKPMSKVILWAENQRYL